MPELPEVETMRRGILGALGATVVRVRKCRCKKKPIGTNEEWSVIARRLKGKTVSSIDRHGKRLILRFGTKWSMVIEPRMTGLMLVNDPPTEEHMRFEIELQGGKHEQVGFWDRRGLGQVYLLDQAGLEEYLSPNRIGPDALEITEEQLRTNLKERRIAVKVGLLDQKAIAGVGNIYASEILHLCGVDPRRKCNRVSKKDWSEIHDRTLLVMRVAIDHEGSTLADGTYRNALNDPGQYQNEHRVYDREGMSCPTCRVGTIQRIVQAQRSTYYCNKCQRR